MRKKNAVLVLTYELKHGGRKEFLSLVERFLRFKERSPRVFEGLESWRLFQLEPDADGSYLEI
jgi:hypothetical protein